MRQPTASLKRVQVDAVFQKVGRHAVQQSLVFCRADAARVVQMHLALIDTPMHQIDESPALLGRTRQALVRSALCGPAQQTGHQWPAHGLRLGPFMRCIQVLGVMWLALLQSLAQSRVGGQSGLPCLALEAVGLGQVGRQQSV